MNVPGWSRRKVAKCLVQQRFQQASLVQIRAQCIVICDIHLAKNDKIRAKKPG